MSRQRLLVVAVALLVGCPTEPPPPDPLPPPDLLVVVLDTTTPSVVAEAMPNAQAFLDAGLRWEVAVSPSNSTVDSVGAHFQDRYLITSDFAPGADSTAETTLAEKLGAAGYSTLLVSANEVLDHEIFARGFDRSVIRERGTAAPQADAEAVEEFIAAWEALPAPRFGWLQLLAGHDFFSRPDAAPWPPQSEADLPDAWDWYATDSAATDALLPSVFALVPAAVGLTVLTADHGELFGDRGPYMVSPPHNFGHGVANSPMEILVPLGMRGRGVTPERKAGPVSTLDLHRTLLAAADEPSVGDLRTATGLRPPGASLCNLLNLAVTEGGGNMSVWVEPDGQQIVRTHSPDALLEADRPPLLVRWPATGIGHQPNWTSLGLAELSGAQTRFLFDDGLPECKGFRDLCDEYPELEAIGYIDCD